MIARSLRPALAAAAALLVLLPGIALAHAERESVFPDGTGETPTYRPFDEQAPRLVVCKGDSDDRIAAIDDLALRTFNQQLLEECEIEHIQEAVDAVTEQGTTIYVLPGEYREEPSEAAACAQGYDGGVVEYDLIVSCGEVVNLITVAGDSVEDEDISCDNALCDLQIEGTGVVPQDTKVIGGFTEDGDWRKHNGLKADRADGFVLANMAFELFRENAIYVHETDGYLLDRVEANHNDLYGILTFTSDHGVISNCETHHNGDSGIYPGSAADVNQTDDALGNATYTETGPLSRWSVEIFGCDTHHNALGFSGTAGNSVWFHDNDVHHNGAGYVTDSFVGGHPGMPQDHAFLENNRIYSNNVNYYPFVQEQADGSTPPCQEGKPADRGYGEGTVCPAFPVPVGTGVLIAGGNHNLVRDNQIYDNWRNGVMLFYIPSVIRQDQDNPTFTLGALNPYDTSHNNHYTGNAFGFHPADVVQPNGTDVWWDDQGVGNCWQDNTSSHGDVATNAIPPMLPTCGPESQVARPPNAAKSAELLPCATYNRSDNPSPDGCDWFDTPTEPAGREPAPGEESDPDVERSVQTQAERDALGSLDAAAADDGTPGGSLAATGGGALLVALGGGAMLGGLTMRRRERGAVA